MLTAASIAATFASTACLCFLLHGCAFCLKAFRPVAATEDMMQTFHTKEYIEFLKNVTPENQVETGELGSSELNMQCLAVASANKSVSKASEQVHCVLQHCNSLPVYKSGKSYHAYDDVCRSGSRSRSRRTPSTATAPFLTACSTTVR